MHKEIMKMFNLLGKCNSSCLTKEVNIAFNCKAFYYPPEQTQKLSKNCHNL